MAPLPLIHGVMGHLWITRNKWVTLGAIWLDDPERIPGDMLLNTLPYTPGKINMEPENIPLEKGKSSSKPSFSGSILIFGGVHPNASWGSVFRPPKDIWNTSHIGFHLSPLNGCLVRKSSLAALSSGFWYSNLFLWVLQEFYFENIVLYLTPWLYYSVCCFSRWFVGGQNWRFTIPLCTKEVE